MSDESTLSKAVEKLGETDKILVETSFFPEEVKKRIAKKIRDTEILIQVSAFIAFVCLYMIALSTITELSVTFSSDSAETARDGWLAAALIISIFLSLLVVAWVIFLHFRRERSELRQLLIHSGKQENHQQTPPDAELKGE